MNNILAETWGSGINGWMGFGTYSWSLSGYEAQWQEMEYADGIYKATGVVSGNVYSVRIYCNDGNFSGGSFIKVYLGGNENSSLRIQDCGVYEAQLEAGASGTIAIAAFPGGVQTDWVNIGGVYVDESIARPVVGGVLAEVNLKGRGLL